MDKVKLLRIVNPILFISFMVQAATASVMVLHIRVPHLRSIMELHEYNGILMVILVAIHVTLNWGWIRANFFKKIKG